MIDALQAHRFLHSAPVVCIAVGLVIVCWILGSLVRPHE